MFKRDYDDRKEGKELVKSLKLGIRLLSAQPSK